MGGGGGSVLAFVEPVGRVLSHGPLHVGISHTLGLLLQISCKSSFELLATLKTMRPFLAELKVFPTTPYPTPSPPFHTQPHPLLLASCCQTCRSSLLQVRLLRHSIRQRKVSLHLECMACDTPQFAAFFDHQNIIE